jgi:hypothetical protein
VRLYTDALACWFIGKFWRKVLKLAIYIIFFQPSGMSVELFSYLGNILMGLHRDMVNPVLGCEFGLSVQVRLVFAFSKVHFLL